MQGREVTRMLPQRLLPSENSQQHMVNPYAAAFNLVCAEWKTV